MMRASQTNKPQPLPLPLPLPPPPLSLPSTPPTVPRRRSRTASSSSSSSSISTASSFSPSSSPAPSPRTTAATSVVPFSWERRPGLPKSSLAGLISSSGSSSSSTTLPLPPPLLRPSPRRCRQHRRRRAVEAPAPAVDPFAAAFMECTREEGMHDDDADDKLWPAPKTTVSRPWRLAGGGVVGLLDLYRCRSAMDVVDGAFLARRPVAPPPSPGPCRATLR